MKGFFENSTIFSNFSTEMSRIIIFITLLASFSMICGEENRGPCVGCPTESDANDPEVLQKTTQVLATMNSNHQVKKVVSVKKQVVAGLKYIVKFETNDQRVCELSWVEQAWISEEPQFHIQKISITQDGSITILASPKKAEGSVFREAEDGTVLCRVESAVIKEAVDTVRRWNARHNARNDFSRPKGTRLRSLFDEVGALPKPNWSFIEISPSTEDGGAEVLLPLESTLSSPHLFVISGNSLLPTSLAEASRDEIAASSEIQPAPLMELNESASEDVIGFPFNLSSSDSSDFPSVESFPSELCSSPPSKLVPQHIQCCSRPFPIKLLQDQANQCVSFKLMDNALLEIRLQSFKHCECDGGDVSEPYFGPWKISIAKHFVKTVRKEEAAWKKKRKLRGPTWPPEEPYRIKTSSTETCLREGIRKKKQSEVLGYIMDTNTDKFHSEPPINVRLAWFMEQQLKQTELVIDVYNWTNYSVLEWLHNVVGLPQYQDCFKANGIHGRHLAVLDAEGLEKMGIQNFGHVLKITSEIRKLFKTQREKNIWRDVAEARYDPLTLHAMYNYRNVSHRLPVYDFFINNRFINRKVPHYSLFELKSPTWDIFPRNVRTAQVKHFFENDVQVRPNAKKTYDVDSRW